jgi:hypothetical protein
MCNKLRQRFLLPVCIFSLLLLILSLKSFYDQLSRSQAGNDFIAYWAAARLLVNGQNPYLSDQIFILQTSVGWTGEMPLVMYSPPWVLTYILPFSIENYVLGKFLWLVFLFTCMLICSSWLWQFYGGTKADRHWNLVILLSYAPVYFALVKGQIVPLILLGIVGFLHFEQQKKWFLAGTFVCLLGIKPHALYLFFMALIVWIIHKRRWDVMLGAGCSVLVTMAIPFLQNPDIFNQYYEEVLSRSFQYYWHTPTFGYFLRLVLGNEKHYLQYCPTVLGLAWFFYHWRYNSMKWAWAEQMPLLLFMSLMTTFYVWVNDFVLLLVAIIQAGCWLVHYHPSPYSKIMIFMYAVINLLAWVTAFSSPSEEWIIWMPPALFVNYLLLRRFSDRANALI